MVVPVREVEGDYESITPGTGDYEVTYRVEGFTADGGAVIDRERRVVHPPFASRVEARPTAAKAASTGSYSRRSTRSGTRAWNRTRSTR